MQQLTPYQYIKIDLANTFGLDKETWNNRINWVDNNELELEKLISEAKEPILYSKAIRAYRDVQGGEPTNHTMSLDSTASFLQIMSVMMRCTKSAIASNVLYSGKRHDIYTFMQQHMNSTHDTNVTRQQVKDALMPWFYGSKKAPKEVFGEGEVHDAFIQTIIEELPGAYNCMEIMRLTWNPKADAHTWTRPDGATVYCPVTEVVKKRINCGPVRFTHLARVQQPVKKGISNLANFIQSVDAMIMARMVKAAHTQGYQLYGIHDAFYCSPLYMQQTRENYKDILIDLASKPIFANWFNDITGEKQVEDDLNNVPDFVKHIEGMEYHLS